MINHSCGINSCCNIESGNCPPSPSLDESEEYDSAYDEEMFGPLPTDIPEWIMGVTNDGQEGWWIERDPLMGFNILVFSNIRNFNWIYLGLL